jgi:hypothetical protein
MKGPSNQRLLPWSLPEWPSRLRKFQWAEQLRIFLRGQLPFSTGLTSFSDSFYNTSFRTIIIYSNVGNISHNEDFMLYCDQAECYSLNWVGHSYEWDSNPVSEQSKFSSNVVISF